MKRALVVVAAVTMLAGVLAGSAQAATVVVHPGDLDGWVPQTTHPSGSVDFVAGPDNPPLGSGSARLKIGNGTAGGDEAAQLRNTTFAGTELADVTALLYHAYPVQIEGGQAPFIILHLDNTGDGISDDLIFFEPLYQSGFRMDLPDQGPIQLNTWQDWDARIGGWWSLNNVAGAGPGTNVKTIDEYLAVEPDATIVNTSSGSGGVRLVHGFSSPSDEFEGHVDAFTIGVNGANTTYDFDPTPPPPPPPPTARCQGADVPVTAGTGGNDTLIGTDATDFIRGLSGDDEISGVGADDCLRGGNGNDTVRGGAGDDRILGKTGVDKLRGQGGKDRLRGDGNHDRIVGGEGSDDLSGGGSGDRLRGGAARDALNGGAGRDRLNAVDANRDRVNCGPGDDRATVDDRDVVFGNCERVIVRGD